MKPLIRVSAEDASALTRALAEALAGGPAVWPVPADAAPASSAPASPAPASPAPAAQVRSGGAFPQDAGEIGPDSGGNAPPKRTADCSADRAAAEVGDGVALVVETSGSTDRPKRVVLSAEALEASAHATHDALGGPGQWLLALPGHYIAGAQVLVRGILAGTETVVLGGGGDGFRPAAFAETSARMLPNVPHYTSLVPVQLARVVEAAERDAFIAAALRSFDAILVGGQALGAEVAARADALGARIVRTYGSSETAGGCVYDGEPIGDTRIRFVEGAIELAGSSLADGYLDDPERTAAAFVVDRGTRWYRTGDLGELDADTGRLRVRGRADDVMISGGVKVVLGEVERAVRRLDGFADAVVVAVPDAEWGERAAVVVGAPVGDDEFALGRLRQATDAAGLSPAARPVRLVVAAPWPLLASGKPDRRALAAAARR
ncbi:AMP-binding protein [Agromyces endophyticus]|uniref:AMP-binding protein n=1 Tax=Agromyces sp. H17E-10 TaxID=2932244 RepID=UPI001FD34E9C|nr:AMP-binding protein [Agromyces sp. H17E-10]UOQ90618.1 AMP-binding protein [Agromyces sp. H17E-10]